LESIDFYLQINISIDFLDVYARILDIYYLYIIVYFIQSE